jgi:hypothetical protein
MRNLVQETREIRFRVDEPRAFVDDCNSIPSPAEAVELRQAFSHGRLFRPQKRRAFHARLYLRDGDGSWFGVASVCARHPA